MTRERHSFALTRRSLAGMLATSAALSLPAVAASATTVEPDAALFALVDELHSLDRHIEEVCAAHPDVDCDRIPRFGEADTRRWAVLDAIADTKAASLGGCVAKARALRAESVVDDGQNFNAIADSLAEDLIALAA